MRPSTSRSEALQACSSGYCCGKSHLGGGGLAGCAYPAIDVTAASVEQTDNDSRIVAFPFPIRGPCQIATSVTLVSPLADGGKASFTTLPHSENHPSDEALASASRSSNEGAPSMRMSLSFVESTRPPGPRHGNRESGGLMKSLTMSLLAFCLGIAAPA